MTYVLISRGIGPYFMDGRIQDHAPAVKWYGDTTSAGSNTPYPGISGWLPLGTTMAPFVPGQDQSVAPYSGARGE